MDEESPKKHGAKKSVARQMETRSDRSRETTGDAQFSLSVDGREVKFVIKKQPL